MAAICLVLASFTLATPAYAVETPYYVANYIDDRCMSVAGDTADLPIYGTQCSLAEKWEFHEIGHVNGRYYYQIKKTHNLSRCILMRNWGSTAYKAVLYPCLSYDDQYWYRDSVVGGYKFVNKAHGSCMVLRTWQTYVEGSGCGNYDDQIWYLTLIA